MKSFRENLSDRLRVLIVKTPCRETYSNYLQVVQRTLYFFKPLFQLAMQLSAALLIPHRLTGWLTTLYLRASFRGKPFHLDSLGRDPPE